MGEKAPKIRARTATRARARFAIASLRTTVATVSLSCAGWVPRHRRVDRRVVEAVLELRDPLGPVVGKGQVPGVAPALHLVAERLASRDGIGDLLMEVLMRPTEGSPG